MGRVRRLPLRQLVIASALALALAACGDDDGAAPTVGDDPVADSASSGDDAADDDASIGSSDSGGNLVVPSDYLRGDWCDSDGSSWTIEGDTAIVEDPESGGRGEFPVEAVFAKGPGVTLISQTEDEFVFGSADDNATFTRGSC